MTTDDTARDILDGPAPDIESDGTLSQDMMRKYFVRQHEHLQAMATLWLMRDSLIEEAHQFWDVEHADPDESQFEAWKTRIKALEGE